MRYRKKPALIEATQWYQNGDHPRDGSTPIDKPGATQLSEGNVVRFFLRHHIPGGRFCPECGNEMRTHGLLNEELAINGEEVICPGDYIVTDRKGRYYKMSAADFEAQYELYEPVAPPTTPS
jgi:hypothetical protein